jgi:galactose mutarotase-like enzyme
MEIRITDAWPAVLLGQLPGRYPAREEWRPYPHRYGFAMETQYFPNSPNRSNYPSTILRHGEEYGSRTIYQFSVLK